MALTTEQKRQYLISQGYDPDKFDVVEETFGEEPPASSPAQTREDESILPPVEIPKTGAFQALKAHALESALPTLTGIGVAAGAAKVLPTGWGQLASIPIGIGAGLGASAIQRQVETPEFKQELAQTREEHPYASIAGGLIPSLLAFNPIQGFKNIPTAIRGLRNLPRATQGALTDAQKVVLGNAALSTGLQGGMSLVGQDVIRLDENYLPEFNPEKFRPGEFLAETLPGIVLNDPNIIGRKVFKFSPTPPEQYVQNPGDVIPTPDVVPPVEPRYIAPPLEQINRNLVPPESSLTRLYRSRYGAGPKPDLTSVIGEQQAEGVTREDVRDVVSMVEGEPPPRKLFNQREYDFELARKELAQQEEVAAREANIAEQQARKAEALKRKALAGELPQQYREPTVSTDLRQLESTIRQRQIPPEPPEGVTRLSVESPLERPVGEPVYGEVTPELREYQFQVARKRGARPELQQKVIGTSGEEIAGDFGLESRRIRISEEKAKGDTAAHEALEAHLYDMSTAPEGSAERKLYDSTVRVGQNRINTGKLTPSERTLVDTMRKGGATEEEIALEMAVRVAGVERYNRDLRTLGVTESRPFVEWSKDFVAWAKHKLGRASDGDVIRLLTARNIHEAPFGTRRGYKYIEEQLATKGGVRQADAKEKEEKTVLSKESNLVSAENLPDAPVVYRGYQEGYKDLVPGYHLYNLTEDLGPNMVKGSTVTEESLRKAGYKIPAAEKARETAKEPTRESKESSLSIKYASLKDKKTGKVYNGANHSMALLEYLKDNNIDINTTSSEVLQQHVDSLEQGFVNKRGKFLNREETEQQTGLKSLSRRLDFEEPTRQSFESPLEGDEWRNVQGQVAKITVLKSMIKKAEDKLKTPGISVKEYGELQAQIAEARAEVSRLTKAPEYKEPITSFEDEPQPANKLLGRIVADVAEKKHLAQEERGRAEAIMQEELANPTSEISQRAESYRNLVDEIIRITYPNQEIPPASKAVFGDQLLDVIKHPNFEKEAQDFLFEMGIEDIDIPDFVARAKKLDIEYDAFQSAIYKKYNELESQIKTGKRQASSLAKELTKDPTRQQATSPLAAEKEVYIPVLKPEIEKVKTEFGPQGKELGTRMENFYSDYSKLRGKFTNKPVLDLKDQLKVGIKDSIWSYITQDNESARKVLQYAYDIDDSGTSQIQLTAEEQQAYTYLKDNYLQEVLKEQTARVPKGMKLPAGKQFIVPHLPSRSVLNTILNKPQTPEAVKLVADFINYQLTKGHASSQTEAEKLLNIFRRGHSKKYVNVAEQFAPIDRANELRLPPSWREKSLLAYVSHFGDRVARRFAFFDHLDKTNNQISSIVKKALDEAGNSAPSTRILHNIQGFQTHAEVWRDAVGGLIRAGMLGPLTGLKDFTTTPFLGFQHQSLGQALESPFRAWSNLKNGLIRESLEAGVNRINIGSLEIGDTGIGDTVNILRRTRDVLNDVQGRNWFEKMARATAYGQGKWLALDNFNRFQNNRLHAQGRRFLEKFMPDYKTKTALTQDDIISAAKKFAESIQGTYDYRGLPEFAVDGSLAPIFSLSRWSIEKANNFTKHVVSPALNGDFRPLLMATLGGILSGAIIEQITEKVTGRKSRLPSKGEISYAIKRDKNQWDALTYKMAGLASLSGYAGMLGDITKAAMDAKFKNRPQPYENVLVDAFYNVKDVTGELVQALDSGEPEAVVGAISMLLENQLQAYRIMMAHTFPEAREELEKQGKFRDVKMFRNIEDLPVADPIDITASGELSRGREKRFKRTDDLKEAQKIINELIKEAFHEYKNNPEILESRLKGLKANSYQTFPSPKNQPQTSARYYKFLKETQGPKEASERLRDYYKQTELNKMKSSMVP